MSLSNLCDPALHSRDEAIRLIGGPDGGGASVGPDLAHLLRQACTARQPDLGRVERILDIAEAVMPTGFLIPVLRPIIRDCDSRVQSKVFLSFSRNEESFIPWAERLAEDQDPRIRANVIEGLWATSSPRVLPLLWLAAKDEHHRVVANAGYALYIRNQTGALAVIEGMQSREDPAFRCACAWVVRKLGLPELKYLLKPLLLDSNAVVKRAAFKTLADFGKPKAPATLGLVP